MNERETYSQHPWLPIELLVRRRCEYGPPRLPCPRPNPSSRAEGIPIDRPEEARAAHEQGLEVSACAGDLQTKNEIEVSRTSA